MVSQVNDLQNLPLNSLVKQAREQTILFMCDKASDPASCFEIFRRALVEKDEPAQEAILTLYHGLVSSWLQHYTREWFHLNLDQEFMIYGVFARMFCSITPEKFSRFESLGRLLSYLKRCCMAEAFDYLRSFSRENHSPLPGLSYNPDSGADEEINLPSEPGLPTIEEEAIREADRVRFWKVVKQHLPDRADELVIHARFVLDMKPRQIAQTYPAHFSDVREVYRRLGNALWRLGRDAELQQWSGYSKRDLLQ